MLWQDEGTLAPGEEEDTADVISLKVDEFMFIEDDRLQQWTNPCHK
jgi:hypothetical protein